MAGQTVNSVTSAMTGELTSRVFPGLIQRYGKDAATSEKLQRLEMMLIKIHSAVEASEKRTIENSWLLRWRNKMKEAALQGDEVLASFQQRVKVAQDTGSTHIDQKQREAASSSAAAPDTHAGALSSTRSSLFGMVQGIRNARKMLFLSADDDMERLNKTFRRLEVLSSDIGEFIRLLHFEALPKVEQTRCCTSLSTKVHGPTEKTGETRKNKKMKHLASDSNPTAGPFSFSEPSPGQCRSFLYAGTHLLGLECDSTVFPEERQFMLLRDRLEAALAEICKAVDLASRHDLKDLEWLAYWGGILIEANEQGRGFLGTTRACKTVNMEGKKDLVVECDQEEDELGSLVHRLEGLARDVEYFSKLVYVCPTW